MNRRARGQSMAEFAPVLPIMLMIAFTTLDLFNFITARGRVFDLAAGSLEAVAAAKPPDGADFGPAAQRDFLCAQLYAQAAGLAASAGLPGSDALPATGGCSSTPTNGARLAVDLIALSSISEEVEIGANPNTELPFGQLPSTYEAGSVEPINVRVCVAYLWPPGMGVFYFARGIGLGAEQVDRALTWRFCGRTALDPRRSY